MVDKKSDLENAKEIINRGGISKITDDKRDGYFVVVGTTGTYLVVPPSFCSCDNFIFRCIKTPDKICKHLIAVMMCKEPKNTENIDITEFFIPIE